MVKKNHDENEKKSGFTIGEIQGKMQKYGMEICLCSVFILSAIFTLIWGGMWVFWAIILCMAGGICGVLFPLPIQKVVAKALQFIYREKFTSILIGILAIVISIFLPPVIFALVGIVGGKSFVLNSRALD